jgi:hypothetical protein
LDRGLTYFGGVVKGYPITGFTMQAFFTLVEKHDGELKENILQQISRLNWRSCWRNPYHNHYEIDPGMFIQKVWHWY